MNSIAFTEDPTKKSLSGRVAKAAILLGISLGLLWFSADFPPFLLFEPQSPGWLLWISYANDLILPFALYFLICLGERWLRTWQGRALFAFAIPTLLEIGQGLYYQFPTSRYGYVGSFDPMDIVMYATSVGMAVLLEQKVFARAFKFWSQ